MHNWDLSTLDIGKVWFYSNVLITVSLYHNTLVKLRSKDSIYLNFKMPEK